MYDNVNPVYDFGHVIKVTFSTSCDQPKMWLFFQDHSKSSSSKNKKILAKISTELTWFKQQLLEIIRKWQQQKLLVFLFWIFFEDDAKIATSFWLVKKDVIFIPTSGDDTMPTKAKWFKKRRKEIKSLKSDSVNIFVASAVEGQK